MQLHHCYVWLYITYDETKVPNIINSVGLSLDPIYLLKKIHQKSYIVGTPHIRSKSYWEYNYNILKKLIYDLSID
jgi:hypothetical protein